MKDDNEQQSAIPTMLEDYVKRMGYMNNEYCDHIDTSLVPYPELEREGALFWQHPELYEWTTGVRTEIQEPMVEMITKATFKGIIDRQSREPILVQPSTTTVISTWGRSKTMHPMDMVSLTNSGVEIHTLKSTLAILKTIEVNFIQQILTEETFMTQGPISESLMRTNMDNAQKNF